MLNPNPVSRKQMQNLDLFFIQMSLFINFIRTIFFKMSLCCFTNFLLWNCGLWNAKTNCLKIPPDTCPSASAILNPMNLAPGLVSWFHESGFGFRKSGLNKRHGFWNRFQFWSNQTGPELELGFGFDQSLPRGKPVGKSPYYHSFDRSANWRVKDSIGPQTSFW